MSENMPDKIWAFETGFRNLWNRKKSQNPDATEYHLAPVWMPIDEKARDGEEVNILCTNGEIHAAYYTHGHWQGTYYEGYELTYNRLVPYKYQPITPPEES